MRSRRGYRTGFCLVSLLCMVLGQAGGVPLTASSGSHPPPDLGSDLPRSIQVASWQDTETVDPGPQAADPSDGTGHVIHLKSRQIEPSPSNALSLDEAAGLGQRRIHVLVQLDYIPRQVAKEALQAQGIELLAYVPDYAWIAALHASDVAATLELPGVTWIGELTVDDKLAPAIREGRWSDYNLLPDGTAAVHVVMHGDETLDTGRGLVQAHGGRVMGQAVGIKLLVVEMPRENVRALAAEDAVQWVEPVGPPLTPSNDGIRAQIGVDIVNADPYNLDGTGIDVLVYDSGQAGDHADFGARLIHGDTDTVSDHSTHVAGTVGGDGTTTFQWRGMAPEVDLISYGTGYSGSGVLFYENVPDIEADWAAAQNTYGADLGTASLGSNIYSNYPDGSECDVMGKYGPSSRLIDQIVRGGNSAVGPGDKYIATWAAGNERGWGDDSCGTYAIVAPPAGAKNPIHVGGSNTNNNTQYAHTSWGPTEDGRLKPIVTAGACQTSGDFGITSTDDNPLNGYTVKCGTSMATPAVAGGIALMLQHYRDVYNTTGNFWPSTAKAILMQTAQDLGRAGPDYEWGYGLVNIHAAVDLISRKAFRQANVSGGEVDVYYFIVPDNDPVTVSLAWDDFEATLNANPTLINNLDLELVAPSGTLWRPWVLNPASPTALATRGVDNRNNQEQVQVPAPEIGTWIVRVRGTTVPQGPQDYTLVCEGCQPLTVGACQSTLDGTASAMTADNATASGQEEEQVLIRLAPELSEGERWQRALEAGTSPQELSVRLISEGGEVVYSIPGPAVPGVADAGAVPEVDVVRQAYEALDAASAVGPEAVVGLLETLPSQALDAVIAEIADAREWLGDPAPLREQVEPLTEEQEQALAEEQAAIDAANRAQALTRVDDAAENGVLLETHTALLGLVIGPAADLTVGSGCTYATIAAAIAAANPGDRLLIEGGVTFAENVVVNKNLTLQGGYTGCTSGSSARTTVDGGGGGSVVTISSGLGVTLLNLNLTNGNTGMEGGGIEFAIGSGTGTLTLTNVDIYGNQGQWGGGLWVGPDAQVVGTGVSIYNNTATAYGGGVRLYGGRITLSASSIHDNVAPLGGGVYAALQNTYAPVLSLSNTDVYANDALTGNGQGGGVYVRQGTVSMADNSDLINNDAIDGGGANLVTGTLTIGGSASWIYNNTATGNGGGVYAQGSTINLDDGAELYNNDAGTDGTGSGGGAYLDDGNLYGDRALIRYNVADDFGGGVYAINGSVASMDLGAYTCLGVRCSQLYANSASSSYGGGIYANGSTVYLYNTFIEANSAYYGGGLYAYNGTAYVYNSVFARNVASGVGDGVRLYTGATMYSQGTTFAYNDSGGAATGTAIGMSGASLDMYCSIVWGHATGISSATEDVTYSDIQGGYDGAANLNVNPQFVASGSSDYHLQATSSLIDRCPSGVSPDFENERRPIVRDMAASPYDMGADEVAGVARVGVNGTCAYATIQQAVNTAQDGDTVRVAAGVYFETVNISSKSVTVEGGYDSSCTTVTGGETRIEGSAGSGSTIDVTGGTVALRHLQIAWGNGVGAGVDARSGAQVTLEDSDVLHNHGTSGGGIYVDSTSRVTIDDDSDVRDNTASTIGGGAYVLGTLNAYDTNSDIYYNCAPHGGGFYVPGGTLYLNAADVYGNEAVDAAGRGGGIYLTGGGVVTMTNTAYVYYLNRAYDGAGIHANASTVYLVGALTTLRDNIATHGGGGVYLANGSTLRSTGARIGQPGTLSIANEAPYGAGIYALNSTVEFAGSIVNNLAADRGAGIYADASVLYLTNATVGGASTSEVNRLGPSGYFGVGLYLTNGTQATLENTVVSSNTFQTTGTAYGGGAYLAGGSVMTLTNSTVEGHVAPSTTEGRGAGIYVNASTVILDGSRVLSNTAGTVGGGIRMWGTSTLVVSGGSTIGYNESLNGEGGAIAATGTPDIDIVYATLSYNSASGYGGVIYLDAGTLDVTRAILHHNSAARGGAIYQMGSGASTVHNSLIYANTTSEPFGAGIRTEGGGFAVTHVTIADNIGGAGYSQAGTSSWAHNNIVWGNTAGGFVGTFVASSCNIDQNGNIGSVVNPQFVGGGDYHLTPSSPAVDACGSGISPDLDGVVRPSGSSYDMGAYEYLFRFLYLPIVLRGW